VKFPLLFNFRFNLNFIRFSKTVYITLDQTREVTVGAPQRMRIGATCPISKIERSISRLFRTNREDFLHYGVNDFIVDHKPLASVYREWMVTLRVAARRIQLWIKCINSVLTISFSRDRLCIPSKEGNLAQRTSIARCC